MTDASQWRGGGWRWLWCCFLLGCHMPRLTTLHPCRLSQYCLPWGVIHSAVPVGSDYNINPRPLNTSENCEEQLRVKDAAEVPGVLGDVKIPEPSWRHQTTTAENTSSTHIGCQTVAWKASISDGIDHFIVCVLIRGLLWFSWMETLQRHSRCLNNWRPAVTFFCCKDTQQHRCPINHVSILRCN